MIQTKLVHGENRNKVSGYLSQEQPGDREKEKNHQSYGGQRLKPGESSTASITIRNPRSANLPQLAIQASTALLKGRHSSLPTSGSTKCSLRSIISLMNPDNGSIQADLGPWVSAFLRPWVFKWAIPRER